jgi:glucosyl-dolichyl phosphate glucuronosyltransferase
LLDSSLISDRKNRKAQAMENVHLSVIICTYNRSQSLQNTLGSFMNIHSPKNVKWEMVIVDNNSTDDTRGVVFRFAGICGFPCRYVFEEKQGLSHARNRGIQEAGGEILSFTDDDVVVDRDWLLNIWKAFHANDVACIGGKILPVWEKPRPRWLEGDLLNFLALQDLGEEKIKLANPVIWGANLAVLSSMFRRYGVFDTSLGNNEGKLYGGEETEFVRMLLERGETVLYCPDVLVHHCIPGFRMRKSYFRKWVYDKGELKALQMGVYRKRNFLGIPFYLLNATLQSLFDFIFKQLVFSRGAFQSQLTLIYYMGFLAGRLKYRNKKAQEI